MGGWWLELHTQLVTFPIYSSPYDITCVTWVNSPWPRWRQISGWLACMLPAAACWAGFFDIDWPLSPGHILCLLLEAGTDSEQAWCEPATSPCDFDLQFNLLCQKNKLLPMWTACVPPLQIS